MLEEASGSEVRLEAASAEPGDPRVREVERLEGLLAARASERRELADELARTTALLRDALARFAELPRARAESGGSVGPITSTVEAAATAVASDEAMARLRAERDEAIARALEAEAARSDTAFRLDEALGHVLAAQHARDEQAVLAGTARGLRARAAEAEEALGVLEARLMLGEQDLADARELVRARERETLEASERFEVELLRLRTSRDEEARRVAQGEVVASALRGERDGLAARADEAERAFAGARARLAKSEQALAETNDKLVVVRAEYAEEQVRVRAQAAQLESSASRQDDRIGSLRRVLQDMRAPLRDFAAAVHGVALGTGDVSSLSPATEVTEDPTVPGMALPPEALDALQRRLDASERRVQELEAALANRAASSVREAAAGAPAPRDLSALKGELIDVRASAARLSDDLARERSRRRKLAFTVHALQAASESGEGIRPWIDELLAILSEGATVPPPANG